MQEDEAGADSAWHTGVALFDRTEPQPHELHRGTSWRLPV
jgi:hypothetical protein